MKLYRGKLLNSSMDVLGSRKFRDKFVYCVSCGEEMHISPVRICFNCSDKKYHKFNNHSEIKM